MVEMEKCNATTHKELNKDYASWYDKYGTKRFQAMSLILSADSEQYSGIWNDLNNSTLLVIDNYPKPKTAAYILLCRYKKPALPRQVHAPPTEVIFFQSGDT